MAGDKWKRNIAAFLSGQAISMFGSSLVQFAIVWYIARTTSSGVMLTISLACAFVPQLIISMFAGVWADRYNKKMLIIVADGSIALVTLVLALMMINGGKFLWSLMAVSAVRSLFTGIQTPAVNALIPVMVPEENLIRINSINGSVQSVINLVAPAVGGVILSFGDIYNVLFVDVLTAMIGIGIFLFIPINFVAKRTDKPDVFKELKEGVFYCKNHHFIKRLMILSAIGGILFTPASFLNVLMVTRVFGDSYLYLTLNQTVYCIGSALGGVALSIWGGFKNRIATLAMGLGIFGLFNVIMGVVPIFWIYLIAMFIVGLCMSLGTACVMTLIQEKVDSEVIGRVFGIYQIIFSGVLPLSMAVFGPLSDAVPVQFIIIGAGALMMCLAMYIRLYKSFYMHGVRAEKTDKIQNSSL